MGSKIGNRNSSVWLKRLHVLTHYPKAFAFMMLPASRNCAIQRLQWISIEIHKGRQCSVAFSYNQATKREKIKFVLEDTYQFTGVFRPCLLGAVSAASFAFDGSITTDKGHRSHDGRTIIEFWVQQVASPIAGHGDCLLPPPPASPDVDPSRNKGPAEGVGSAIAGDAPPPKRFRFSEHTEQLRIW